MNPAGPLMNAALLRELPAVDRLKRELAQGHPDWPDELHTIVVREVVDGLREAVRGGEIQSSAALASALDAGLRERVAAVVGPRLRRVLNGTGVIVHTNAGRAPLAAAAVAAITDAAAGYCNLELDLQTGRRGSRQDLLRPLLRWLCGAEDALVVNNNAAAVMLALHALAAGRPVVVSRGELVEIGGSFRIPDVMRAAGARLVEVGTTNRTWLRDYEAAFAELSEAGDPPAAFMQVHRSNFELQGFVNTPDLGELAALAKRVGVPLISDLGAGALADPTAFGLAGEPTVAQTLAAGADIATFSGDKLVGGPQAGIVVGRKELVRKLGSSPMARAVRVGSLTLGALEGTLRTHLLGRSRQDIPALRAASLPMVVVRAAAQECAAALTDLPGFNVTVQSSEARVGGGSQPGRTVPSCAVCVRVDDVAISALAPALRACRPALIGRVRDDALLLDMRSLLAANTAADVAAGVRKALCEALSIAGAS